MGLLADWRASRERGRRSAAYLASALQPPEPADVAWLAELCGRADTAARELWVARRAVALIVAERDALDDRTASDVSHQLAGLLAFRGTEMPDVTPVWAERWRGYSSALALRGAIEAPAGRLGRVLLAGAGIDDPSAADVARATQIVVLARTQANEALRAVFGAAALPEDVRPSAMR